MEVLVLGPLIVRGAGGDVIIGARKERALVTALAWHTGETVLADRLVAVLWGESSPPSARQTLRGLVSRVRRALGSDAVLSEASGSGYRLALAPEAVDAWRFRQGLTVARQAASREPAEALRLVERALGEWRGEPLVDLADDPDVAGERVRLGEFRLAAFELRNDLNLALGRHREVVGDVEALVAAHPLRERLWGQLMVALYRAGRQAEALQAFQRARALLVDELGVEPGPQLRELEESVLTHDDVRLGHVLALPAPAPSNVLVSPVDDEASDGPRALLAVLAGRGAHPPCHPGPAAGGAVAVELAHRGGVLVEIDDDEVLAEFASIADALGAAHDLHRRVAGPPRVGVGVLARSGDPRDHRAAARTLAAAAHPGQVLVSAAAAAACGPVPAGLGLLDIGTHAVQPRAVPERLYRLVSAEGPAGGPAPVTAGAVPNNLTLPGSTFVGRLEEVDALAAALRRHRLVTLVGPGGVGKTRLAVHLAEAVLPRFPDGVWLVDLSGVRSAEAVVDVIAGVLNLRVPSTAASPLDGLVEQLGARRLLVVLDNCEHVAAAAARAAATLLRAPLVQVVATSREALAISAESLRPVRPLAPDDAALLFRDRAWGPASGLRGGDDEVVHELCRRLDGLPLAIELAAAGTSLRTPRELLDSLLLGELRGRARRDMPVRHHTLRRVAEDSYRLLEPAAQLLFRRIGVFARHADWEALAEVAGMSDDDLDGHLAQLVEASLVVTEEAPDGRMRYRLLETLKGFAREWLAGDRGQQAEIELRHGQWAARLVARADEGLRGPRERAWHERLDLDFDEIRLAHERALQRGDIPLALALVAPLQHYAIFRVRPELFRLAAQVADHPQARGELAARAHALAGWGAFAQLDCHRALAHTHRALAMGSSPYVRAVSLSTQAAAFAMSGDPDRGRAVFQRAVQIARQSQDPYWLPFLVGFGLAMKAAGVDLGGEEHVEEGRAAAQALGVASLRSFVAIGQGYAMLPADPAAARRHLLHGVDLAEAAGCTYLADHGRVGLATSGGGDQADLIDLADRARGWCDKGDHFQALVNLLNVADGLDALGRSVPGKQLRAAVVDRLGQPTQGDPLALLRVVALAQTLASDRA